MKDQNKTKKQLIDEIAALRQRVDALETLEKEHKETEEALREIEGQFGLVADSLPVLISYIDSQQRYRSNNKAYERWFGHHREDVYGKHIKEVLGEPAYEVIRQYVEKVLSGQQVSFERWVFNKAGEDRYIRAFYVPHFGKEGKVKGSFAFVDDLTEHKRKDEELERYEQSLERLVEERTEDLRKANEELQRDITQRKQAEDALRENVEMFRALAETVTSGIAVFQGDKYCYVNPAVSIITGYTQEELLAMRYWDFVHPDFKELVKERGFARQRGEMVPSRYEVKIVSKCEEIRWIDVSASFIKFKGVPAALVALLDITKRKQAEEQIIVANERLQYLLSATPAVIYSSKTSGDYGATFISNNVNPMTGFEPQEFIETSSFWINRIHPEDVQRIMAEVRKLSEQEYYSYEYRFQCKDGTYIWVRDEMKMVREKEGKPLEIVGYWTDITERKRMEDLLKIERDLGLALSATSGLNETLSLCFDAAIRASGMDSGGIYLVNEISGDLNLVFHKGLSADFVKSASHFDADSTSAHFVILGKPIYTQHQELCVFLSESERSEGLHTIAVIPVQFENKVIACLNISSHILDEVPDFARTALETIATQIGNAIIRTKAEETLLESKANLSALIENTNDWICSVDSEFRILTMNRALRNMFFFVYEIELEEGMNLMECFPPERRPFWVGVHGRALRGQHFTFEEHYDPEGISIDVNVSVNPIVAENGEITGVSYFMRDITEQKQVERTLRESQELYRSLFEGVPVGLYRTMPNGEILDANQAFVRMLGYLEPASLLMANLVNMYAIVDERKQWEDLMEKEGIVRDFEARLRRRDETVIWVRDTCHAVRNSEGQILYHEGAIQDITEHKRAEEELRSSREQLRALSAHLQSVREEERALIAREIHDELGQELTGLKMDLSWVIKRLPDDQELLIRKTESMSKLVDNTIQSVRRISTKLRPGVLDDLGLTAAIDWQAQDFQNRTGISCEFHSNLREVDLDQDRSTTVFRILQETLTNVVRHASATHVNIFLKEETNSLVLVVEDNGRGITEGEASDPKSLGLLGMRERALVFGGEVEIRGSPGRGTTVTLKIPQQK